MNYSEAMEFIHEKRFLKTRLGLDSIRELLNILGNPQENLRFIHVAGSNGKGSTAAFLAEILLHEGYKTGLFTTPYIDHFTERIRINSKEISHADTGRLTEKIRDAIREIEVKHHPMPTIFEIVMALSLLYFKENHCDIVIIEAGIGGRNDASNIIPDPLVSVITLIGINHTKYLGNSLSGITLETAGIIRHKGTVVSYPQSRIVKNILVDYCHRQSASIEFLNMDDIHICDSTIDGQKFQFCDSDTLTIPRLGKYLVYNAALAIKAIQMLRKKGFCVSENSIKYGLRSSTWKGRIEILSKKPLIIMDDVYTIEAAENMYRELTSLFPLNQITFITGGTVNDPILEISRIVGPIASRFISVSVDQTDALQPEKLAELLSKEGYHSYSCGDMRNAVLTCCKKYPDEIMCVFGSLKIIRSAKKTIQKNNL